MLKDDNYETNDKHLNMNSGPGHKFYHKFISVIFEFYLSLVLSLN